MHANSNHSIGTLSNLLANNIITHAVLIREHNFILLGLLLLTRLFLFICVCYLRCACRIRWGIWFITRYILSPSSIRAGCLPLSIFFLVVPSWHLFCFFNVIGLSCRRECVISRFLATSSSTPLASISCLDHGSITWVNFWLKECILRVGLWGIVIDYVVMRNYII